MIGSHLPQFDLFFLIGLQFYECIIVKIIVRRNIVGISDNGRSVDVIIICYCMVLIIFLTNHLFLLLLLLLMI